jgi:hypothetical protein
MMLSRSRPGQRPRRPTGSSAALAALVFTSVVLLLASPARAVVTTSSQTQPRPGVTERVIWGQDQVAIYRISGVNHVGPLHIEVHWRPTRADLDIYLLDPGQTPLNESQGLLGKDPGRQAVDWYVSSISAAGQQLAEDPLTHELRPTGDTYYVVVTAFNGAGRFWIGGNYPRIVAGGGSDTVSLLTLESAAYRRPLTAGATVPVSGAAFGNPFDYVPTSVGAVSAALEWPANVATKRVTYDPVARPQPANFGHYGFAGTALDPVFASFGPADWSPPVHGDPPSWYGLSASYTVAPSTPTAPGRLEHYVPVLFLAAKDPAAGPIGGLRTGVTTVGYRATLDFPQNLYLASAPGGVLRGMPVALLGGLARDGRWAPAGTPVRIQRLRDGRWRTVVTVRVGKNGGWTAILYPQASATWRAEAVGDPLTGLALEHTVQHRIVVYSQ